MGYLHIDNLYKNQIILMFKECYALEKIHGTSAHIKWKAEEKRVCFYQGGETYDKFVALFDKDFLEKTFLEISPDYDIIVFGEAYGGKQQGMRKTYGDNLKFVGFDVKVGEYWLNVPKAESVCKQLNVEFVDYVKIPTDLDKLNFERDKDSVQAIRNGCGEGKLREGVVLRPIEELRLNNGERVISKHKRDEFKETKTPREVKPEEFVVLTKAKEIADEWVTEMRLTHVLGKLSPEIGMNEIPVIIKAMQEDVLREAKDEIVESKEALKAIGSKTAVLFKQRLQNSLKTV